MTEVGYMTTFYLRPIPLLPSTQQVGDLAYLFKEKVGARGLCLLPSTFGKVEVEVEGTTFPQAGSLKIIDLSPGGAGKVPSGTNM
jgi:hypothetical protein